MFYVSFIENYLKGIVANWVVHLTQAVDDDGEDSVSASAESLMEEDQADGFLATSPVVDLAGVTATATAPWVRDGCTATTTSNITTSSNTTTASTVSTTGIPGHNLPGSPNCTTVLRRGSLSSPKAGTEEPGGAGGATGGVGVLFEWFTPGSLVKSKIF